MTDIDSSCFRPRTAAEVRYTRRAMLSMSAYVAMLFLSVGLLRGPAGDWPIGVTKAGRGPWTGCCPAAGWLGAR